MCPLSMVYFSPSSYTVYNFKANDVGVVYNLRREFFRVFYRHLLANIVMQLCYSCSNSIATKKYIKYVYCIHGTSITCVWLSFYHGRH